jgi:hypothetical protein
MVHDTRVEEKVVEYLSFGAAFGPWLSIMDVLMVNPVEVIDTGLSPRYNVL